MSRLIDADALLEGIAELKESPWYENFSGRFFRKEAVEIIEDLCIKKAPTIDAEPMWIPCSERMPKYNKTVLISVKQKGKEATVFTAQRRKRVKTPDIFECCTDNDGWWDFRISAWDDHEVIAWMPLPEPYREDGE